MISSGEASGVLPCHTMKQLLNPQGQLIGLMSLMSLMINPVNLYGVVFSSLVASGFWTNFQCFNENVDCRISFYSNRFWNSLVLCLGACVSVILSLRLFCTNPRPSSVPASATGKIICLVNTMWPCARTLGQDPNDFKMICWIFDFMF